jgi:hypothetical protein
MQEDPARYPIMDIPGEVLNYKWTRP